MNPQFILISVLTSLCTGLIVFIIQKYVERSFLPELAMLTLKQQNYLNQKKDAYLEALNILAKKMSSSDWTGPAIPPSRKPTSEHPTEIEVNTVYQKLCIFSEKPEIPHAFINFFDSHRNHSAADLGAFINLLRSDLGYDKGIINHENDFMYMFLNK